MDPTTTPTVVQLDESTTPALLHAHGIPPRGLTSTAASSTTTGRFGRMFRRLPAAHQDPLHLVELGETMIEEQEGGRLDKPLGQSDDDENISTFEGELRLPSAYTYFGQFVDHDITFDPVSSLTAQNDPDALVDFRTPKFDLDSLYGRGPADQPYMYEPGGLRLAEGEPRSGNPEFAGPDLPRVPTERAIIGDPRNDENLIVSQLQSTFIRFHNAVVQRVINDHPTLSPSEQFTRAQRRVRWHYQWVVIHDFLARLVGRQIVDDLVQGDADAVRHRLSFYRWRSQPFMPVEFSVAAYRFGHSMARPSYLINDVIPVPVVGNADRIPFFSQTGGPLQDLNGFRVLPNEWGVQWKYLLPEIDGAPGPNDGDLPQPSYRIDTSLANPLGALPESVSGPQILLPGVPAAAAQILSVRNLIRGLRLGLPSGQSVAHRIGASRILTDAELLDDVTLSAGAKADLTGNAPLWFYILKEAEVIHDGAHLGPVGGRIVAEVLVGLLAGDPSSYLSIRPAWKPTLPGRKPNTFTLTDVVNISREVP